MRACGGLTDQRLLARATVVIGQRYREPDLRLADVAGALRVSPRTLQRACARSPGEPFRVRLRQVRLAAAAELLAGQAIAVRDVARLVGYRAPSAFTAAFTARYAVAPADFRAQARAAARPAPITAGAARACPACPRR